MVNGLVNYKTYSSDCTLYSTWDDGSLVQGFFQRLQQAIQHFLSLYERGASYSNGFYCYTSRCSPLLVSLRKFVEINHSKISFVINWLTAHNFVRVAVISLSWVTTRSLIYTSTLLSRRVFISNWIPVQRLSPSNPPFPTSLFHYKPTWISKNLNKNLQRIC